MRLKQLALALGVLAAPFTAQAQTLEQGNFETSAGYSQMNINEKKYSEGVSFNTSAKFNIPVTNWAWLHPEAEFNLRSLGALEENVSNLMNRLHLSFEGRTPLYHSDSNLLYLGIGGMYKGENDDFQFNNENVFIRRDAGGPIATLGIISDYVDSSLSLSALWGKEIASYDLDRNLMFQFIKLNITPKFLDFKVPLTLDVSHWSIFQDEVDKHNVFLKFTGQIEWDALKHVTFLIKTSYSNLIAGNELYEIIDAEAGVKLRW